jgi:cytochrome c
MTRLLPSLALMLSMIATAAEPGKPGDAAAGKRAFMRCASCHQVGPSARGAFGPQLNGIVGRKAGSTADFSYSPAMKQAGIVWTEQKLAAFLKSPKQVVPDNQMRFWGIGDEQQIANLLAYLRTVK